MAPKPVCMAFGTDDACDIVLAHEIPDYIEPWLDDAIRGTAVIINHNIAFDMMVLLEHFPQLADKIWRAYDADGVDCTYLRQRLYDLGSDTFRPKEKYSLVELEKSYFKKDRSEDKGEDAWRYCYHELDGVPLDQWPERAREYPKDDVLGTLKLYHLQELLLEKIGYDAPTRFDEARADLAFKLMSAWGMTVDTQETADFYKETSEFMVAKQRDLMDVGILQWGGTKKAPKLVKKCKVIQDRIAEIWRSDWGDLPVTDKGNIQTSAEVVAMCNDPVLDHLKNYELAEKLRNTYLRHLVKSPIHSTIWTLGATLRTSSSNPNLQNVVKLGRIQKLFPGRSVRGCFRPRKGKVFVIADYNSQEMRTFAQACLDMVGYSRLAEEYKRNPDYDPHQAFADERGGTRQDAKIPNFGLPGGLGVRGLIRYAKGYGVEWEYDQAKFVRDAWFQQWEEAGEFFQVISDEIGIDNYGRFDINGHVVLGLGYTNGANLQFQGRAAQSGKRAAYRIARQCYYDRRSPLFGARPCNFVHDEFVLEADEGYHHQVAEMLTTTMVEAMEEICPDVPSRVEACASTRWVKAAKPVHDDQGRLGVWEPP